ncbi:MlaD family protein [Rhodococcus gannanensis]|uniref:MlaD family protein n=1 Tax=Rhodococcus gannanensis TaxID=1960308 RepID=A0ABW4P9I6_9NOCA
MGNAAAGAVVSSVRFVHARRLAASAWGLALILVLGLGYLTLGVFGVRPTESTMTVRVHLADSGGLLPNQNVTLRGVPIGRVNSLELADDGVVAVATIDDSTQIPVGGEVRVAGLSLAGEQYLDFRPTTDEAPYLTDGAEVAMEDTATPVPLSQMMGNLDGMLAQIDPADVEAIVDELGMSPAGPEKLADIIDGGTFLLNTLDAVLPQTVDLLNTSKVALGTLGDGSRMQESAANLRQVLGGIEAKDSGLRTLLDRTPGALQTIDAVIADNSPTMVKLLGNLATVAQLTTVRVPALQEFFFPKYRDGSTLEALSEVFRDGGVWAAVNFYPRVSCDYDVPRLPPWQADFPEPYLNVDCQNPDQSLLVRGARNAPRPDDGFAGPDPNADRLQKASPSPVGPYSIPLPYAGPDLATVPLPGTTGE